MGLVCSVCRQERSVDTCRACYNQMCRVHCMQPCEHCRLTLAVQVQPCSYCGRMPALLTQCRQCQRWNLCVDCARQHFQCRCWKPCGICAACLSLTEATTTTERQRCTE